jgi:hypothetical protein
MKKIFFLLLSVVILSACQEEDTSLQGKMGYLRLDVAAVSSTNTKSAVPENYNPKQLHVEIKDASGNIVKRTDNFDLEWKGKEMMLSPGNYTIAASSNGFDGNASGEGIPYYMGSTTVTIPADGSSVSASIVCRLANVKVTFRFDTSVLSVFKSLAMEVVSSVSGVLPQSATCSPTERVVYFPVGDLTVRTAVTNMAGTTFPALEKPITGVKARDHYILNCKLGDFGNGGITVEADDSEKEYTYTFEVPTVASTRLGAETPAVLWSRFAHLEGSILSKSESFVPDPSAMRFEWKKKDDPNWNTLASTQEGEKYKATLTGLESGTAYTYRLVYNKESDQYASDEVMFTTESTTPLPYGNMDTWNKSDKTWYLGAVRSFWDSSNPGTTTGAGALVNVNPTQGNSEKVHTSGGKSAELKSQYASALGIGKFAAASLYAGAFNSLVGTNGAKIDFGCPFTGRPTQLTGWFQYSTGAIDYVQSGLPVGKGDTDLWSAYIVLTNGKYQLNNTDMAGTSKDFMSILESGKPDASGFDVIAYGALPDVECVASSEWKQFTINLTYRNLVEKPTHVIIVFSSSKYGDYFTGSTSSTLYLDDLELIYGDSPKLLGSGN